MNTITLNNKAELLQWVKENIKKIEPSAYITELTVMGNTGIKLIGGSDHGGVSTTISYPTMMEKYPCRFTLRERTTPAIDCIENTWSLCMLISEVIKRRNFSDKVVRNRMNSEVEPRTHEYTFDVAEKWLCTQRSGTIVK